MNKHLINLILSVMITASALTSVTQANELEDKYFSKDNPRLTQQEREALAIAQKWQASESKRGVKAFAGSDGSIQFVYGAQTPSIVCAVLQVCDVALQPGEQFTGLNVGDSARWQIEPAISGSGNTAVIHIMIKPKDVGLSTSLVVTTDRRSYYIKLRSHRTEFMPQVSFSYPEEALAKWDLIRVQQRQQVKENTIPSTGEYLGNLSFDYELSGSAPWKPLRVYNDGVKTIIQMPNAMQQTEAPTLLVVRREGGLFTDPETVMVNYRVQDNRYIVDTVFEKAILIAGVGNAQDRVTITKGVSKKPSATPLGRGEQ
ncbi:P-type conjugative transfer protein TrbG [Hahella ganghwensis]|uniref:P-type conjugative transfer protein TrbG n=1 Tax=Hahella ganghwensis TaxID=286420 RepID=UPI00037A802A|nr:P-type conjugative transfer protein TrbG [Hahella ganghwensis]